MGGTFTRTLGRSAIGAHQAPRGGYTERVRELVLMMCVCLQNGRQGEVKNLENANNEAMQQGAGQQGQ